MNEFERRLLQTAEYTAWLGAVLRRNKTPVNIEPYTYNAYIEDVAEGDTGQALIPIQSDSDFVLAYLSGCVLVTDIIVPNHNSSVQITDTGTGKTFFSEPTLFPLVFGTGGFPYLLPSPRVISPNTNIQVDVVNITSAGDAAADYRLSFGGVRVYY